MLLSKSWKILGFVPNWNKDLIVMYRIACWVSVRFHSLMLFSEKVLCVSLASSSTKDKLYSNFLKKSYTVEIFYEMVDNSEK